MPQWKEHRPSILRPKFAKNLELGFLFCFVLFCLNQMKILCLYDKKAEKFATPFTAINNAVATRDFSRACAEPNSAMAQFPDDIELCYLGDFDEITGRIIPLKEIATIATAKEYCTNGKGNDKPNNPNNN